MIYVGIDWADATHSVCILDESGKKVDQFTIAHSQGGFDDLDAHIRRQTTDPAAVAVAIETKHSLLVDFLIECNYTLYFLNPKQTDRFRDRHRMARSKSDRQDAFVLADALRTDQVLFAALSPLDDASLALRVLTRTRQQAVERKTAIQNELTAVLKRYYPVAAQYFRALDHPASVAFLLAYPSLQDVRGVTEEQIVQFLRAQAVPPQAAQRQAKRIRMLVDSPQPQVPAAIRLAYQPSAESILRQLQAVMLEIATLDKQIATLYESHQNKDLLDSLPGVGAVLGPILAGELGADIMRFADVQTLKAYAGTAPVTVQSGQYRKVFFRRACNAPLRRALHLISTTCLRTCAWARAIYQRQRERGKRFGTALRVIADQFVEMLAAILRRRRPYDEGYHRQMQEQHGRLALT